MLKKLLILSFTLLIVSPFALYYGGKWYSHYYADKWADTLIELDNKGLLSKSFGAAWQDVVYGDEMSNHIDKINGNDTAGMGLKIIRGIPVNDYPSLTVVKRINSLNHYSNSIRVLSRTGETVGQIRTDHKRAPYDSLPATLVKSVVASEDKTFFENTYGFEYDSFVRAAVRAVIESVKSLSLRSPRGTSTVTQQVAKMFVSQLDNKGQRFVARSIDRKLREIRIAAALRKIYSPEEIMEVYLNHCLTSSHGLIGAADISEGLWGKPISTISDAESIYLSRMVKWGMNFPEKIKRQCKIDMGRIAPALGWSSTKSAEVLKEIDQLEFKKPVQVSTQHGHLMDLANHYWQEFLKLKGYTKAQIKDFDILSPSSLIRKKGNIEIKLTIDLGLQRFLEKSVNSKGFGKDTTITTDVRIGSLAEEVKVKKAPKDVRREISVLKRKRSFSEPDSSFTTTLLKGDTLVTNIRYVKIKGKKYRKSSFFYKRGEVKVDGQYFAYAIIDSKTGKLLAYYSRDKIGSRAASLLSRRTPNGSSTAKPILNALAFDTKQFLPYDKWSDLTEVAETLPWARDLKIGKDSSSGEVTFLNVGSRKKYRVKNHGNILEGELFIFDQLAKSNNILAVETLLRLNSTPFNKKGDINGLYFEQGSLLYRLEVYDSMKSKFAGKEITGVRFYKELARIVGAEVDSTRTIAKSHPIADNAYSVALGTLELTLLEQLHLFNLLYNNTIIENPKDYPSLFISKISIQGKEYLIDSLDRRKKLHPFSSKQVVRPTLLGLHKRLGEQSYDIYTDLDTATSNEFNQSQFRIEEPLSNFAKSGTTDDILRPYNADPSTTKERTNYCLWNGVVRVDLSSFSNKTNKVSPEIKDITFAAVGEGITDRAGWRDGKSLHQYLSKALLKKGGLKVENGYFHQYENYLKSCYEFENDRLKDIDTLLSDNSDDL
jgi:membrane peptidoglycan carboxypeptidase